MLERGRDHADTRARFRWRLPTRYNIGVDAVDRHAGGPQRLALIHVEPDGTVTRFSFDQIRDHSNALANAFAAFGLKAGDRVGILLPQAPETAIAHIACYKAGLIALPLFTLFEEEALHHRLADSGARAVVTDMANWPKLESLRDRLPDLDTVLVTDPAASAPRGTQAFWPAVARASLHFEPVATGPDTPALLIYTSGTTGPPKGALHGHRVLPGHLPGVEFPHDFPPQPGDRFWTPADWAWIGGLLDVLLPAWHHGLPVVSHRMAKFDPDAAFDLITRLEIRNMFLPPTALKLMRQAEPTKRPGPRTIGSGGETLGAELLDWGRQTFGVPIHEFYGQTECNLIVGNNAMQAPLRPGSMGLAIPGHEVAIVDGDGALVPPGKDGEIAVRRGDPVMFLRYWNLKTATEAKYRGDWLLTGDMGRQDEDGYFWFVGRDDDVITSAGYRIGPGEIETCLLGHPSVAMAAVVGVADPVRTEIVKAVVVLKPGIVGDDALKRALQDHVRSRLAAHEYPRLVSFVDALPMTATGKIVRRALRER
ncbi:MAG: AMP-binding protein [Inquilinaceae bacterium]